MKVQGQVRGHTDGIRPDSAIVELHSPPNIRRTQTGTFPKLGPAKIKLATMDRTKPVPDISESILRTLEQWGLLNEAQNMNWCSVKERARQLRRALLTGYVFGRARRRQPIVFCALSGKLSIARGLG
jgi:hypothetical protein